MEELKEILLGDLTLPRFIGYFILFLIGVAYYSVTEVSNRNVDSANTPKKFSWKFFIKDNWKRYIAVIIVIYATIVFYPNLSDGQQLTPFTAFMLGVSIDVVIGSNKKKISVLRSERSEENIS
jgi:hypothetical protein